MSQSCNADLFGHSFCSLYIDLYIALNLIYIIRGKKMQIRSNSLSDSHIIGVYIYGKLNLTILLQGHRSFIVFIKMFHQFYTVTAHLDVTLDGQRKLARANVDSG